MKTVLLLMFGFGSSAFSQRSKIPSFLPQETHEVLPYIYVLQDDDNYLTLLRKDNRSNYEWIQYAKKDTSVLCTRIRSSYFIFQGTIQLCAGKAERIIKKDSLIYGITGNLSELPYIDLNGAYYKKGEFYNTRWDRFFERKPIIGCTEDNRFKQVWYINPFTGLSLINGPCNQKDNLDCLCAVLTHGKQTEREKADALAEFIIDRFEYNRGDTAQNNIKGLVFGNEGKAVCEGYSRVYKDLMERIGIKTDYVTGAVRTSIYDVFYSGFSHAWNQTQIEKEPFGLDITWADNIKDRWYLMAPKDLLISHYVNENHQNDAKNIGDTAMTMYEFMHQPLIYPIVKGGATKVESIDKTIPFQIAQDKFTLNFKENLNVLAVHRIGLSYPFVKFQGQKIDVASKPIATSGEISKKISTKKLEIDLPEQINNFSINIEGIGTLHYVVFNGTEKEFYQYLIDQKEPESPHSMALAFMACAKLNDSKIYSQLKSYMVYDLSFQEFMSAAKKHHIDEFKFTMFNATNYFHFGADLGYNRKKMKGNDKVDYSGYTFEFSKIHDGKTCEIYLSVSESNEYLFNCFRESN